MFLILEDLGLDEDEPEAPEIILEPVIDETPDIIDEESEGEPDQVPIKPKKSIYGLEVPAEDVKTLDEFIVK